MIGTKTGIYSQGRAALPPFLFNNALEFSGAQRVDLTTPILFGDGSSLHIWVKPQSLNNEALYSNVIIVDPTTVKINGVSFTVGLMTVGTWYDLAISNTSGTVTLWQNANLEDTNSVSDFTISDLGNNANIVVDETAIWDRPITQSIANLLYNLGNGNQSNAVLNAPLLYWNLDQSGADRVALDTSSNRNDGALVGFTGNPWALHNETPFEKYIRLAGISNPVPYQNLMDNMMGIGTSPNGTDIWSKRDRIYPTPIDSLNACLFNFKDVNTFTGIVTGVITHSNLGVKGNGVDSFIDYQLGLQDITNPNSVTISITEFPTSSAVTILGGFDGSGTLYDNPYSFDGVNFNFYNNDVADFIGTTRKLSIYTSSYDSGTHTVFEDGIFLNSELRTFVSPISNTKVLLFAEGRDDSNVRFSDAAINFLSFGNNNLTALEAEDEAYCIQQFRTDVEA